MSWKTVVLDTEGGDRATAYTMSNKILRVPQGLLCTWIGADRVNRFAVVDSCGAVVASGPIGGPCVDNHCGAALARRDSGDIRDSGA